MKYRRGARRKKRSNRGASAEEKGMQQMGKCWVQTTGHVAPQSQLLTRLCVLCNGTCRDECRHVFVIIEGPELFDHVIC